MLRQALLSTTALKPAVGLLAEQGLWAVTSGPDSDSELLALQQLLSQLEQLQEVFGGAFVRSNALRVLQQASSDGLRGEAALQRAVERLLL